IDGFPEGRDPWLARPWLINAIDSGSIESIAWMLKRGVTIDIEPNDGFPALHSAIDRKSEDKYAILRLLIEANADPNVRGIHDWTPLHKAACANDVEAMKLLIAGGADVNARTRIDDYATPLEEARIFGSTPEAVTFLESLT
ncbi:MAG: ankyrin repeat domain-containing protein, partial [Verrucomicrobiota bacterium]